MSIEQNSSMNVSNVSIDGKAHVEDKLNWTKSQDSYFIQLLVTEVRAGNMSSSTFHERIWTQFNTQMSDKFGIQFTVKRLKEKFRRLRGKFRLFKDLLNSTGIGWDASRNTVTGDEDAWRAAVQKNPYLKPFKKKGCDHFGLLHEIFEGIVTSGKWKRSSQQNPLDSDEEREVESVHLRAPQFVNPTTDTPNVDESSVLITITSPHSNKKKKVKIDSKGESSALSEALNALREVRTTKQSINDKASGMTPCEGAVEILEAMIDLDEDLYFKAIEIFRTDDKMTSMFLKMSDARRVRWLERLRS